MVYILSSAGPTSEAALLRAARGALAWSIIQAGQRARVSIGTVLAAEGRRPRTVPATDIDTLWRAYGEAGVSRLEGGGGSLGILIASGGFRDD